MPYPKTKAPWIRHPGSREREDRRARVEIVEARISGDGSELHLAMRMTLVDQYQRKIVLTHGVSLQEVVFEQTPSAAVHAANLALAHMMEEMLSVLRQSMEDYSVNCEN